METTVQESSSETISDDIKTTETAQYAMERSETESTKESESIQDITETYEDMSEYAIVEPETEGDLTSKQKNAVNMLNYIMTITQEINNSKESRLYLESAYSSLINNSDPGLIDTRTQERITNILDTLEQYRMIAEKREKLRYIYEQNRAQALRQAIPDPVGLLSAVSSGNILKSAASVIYMAVDAASSYQNAVTQTDLQYLQDGWQLEDEEAQELHNSRKSTFEYMVDMVRENSLPGEYALNENAVNDFVEWKDKTNLTSKIQWLESNESTYEKFGPFWLELAKSYYESEEYDKCLDAIKKYEGISVKIFRKDYDYAEALPMAIVSAKEIRDKNVYIQTAREYSEVILSNADGENWALRYFVAQIYLDLYKQTGSKEYLQKAYDIALNNVNVLVESQKELNLAYLSDIQEVSVNKEAEDEDREKKEVKQYNKLLKAQRKVELPPVDEALYLNCDLLFALAEQLDISVDEQKKIDAILHENGEPVFLTQALDEKFWFESADKKLDVQNIDIDFDGKTLKIPAVCIADRSRITVSVDGSSGNQTFQDWTVKKVYRPKGADCSDFIVIFTSETAKKYKYESGDKIAVQITPVAESADEILEYDYKATVIQKAFAFKTISFERAAK
ncbi:putative uncharacterized protein [Firmicutes bacterium CAG:56]|nr:putative uncharacterized protein [Firmicutes bacterium CAG:56]